MSYTSVLDGLTQLAAGMYLQRAIVTLTDAQIKALPTTSVEIVAAPGAGKAIFPLAAWFRLNWFADYENIASSSLLTVQAGIQFGALFALLDNVNSDVDVLLASGGPAGTNAWLPLASRASGSLSIGIAGFNDAVIENLPLLFQCANGGEGPLTGGHANNTLKVTVYYIV